MALLVADNITKTFALPNGRRLRAVDEVSFTLEAGQTLALIGESGSGKTTVGRCVLGLIPPDSGSIEIGGVSVPGASRRARKALRKDISVVFQEPYESLNPRMRVKNIIAEPLLIHRPDMPSAERLETVAHIANEVGLPDRVLDRFPRELSGGQQQRVGIARAVVTNPRVIVLDEPTSSLDLSVRGQILNLLATLQATHQTSYLYISHDLATVGHIATNIAVMRGGCIVEQGPTQDVLNSPQHEYTRNLLAAVLRLPTLY